MRKSAKILVAILSVTMLVACAKNDDSVPNSNVVPVPSAETSTPADEITYKKDIVVTFNVNVDSSDPQAFNNPQHKRLYMLTHTPLIVYNSETQQLIPGAAESWDVSDDLVTWTFKLRKGMKFHNGEELKADDVKFTWERGTDSSYSAIKSQFASVTEIKVIDDYTITMKLENPNMDYAYIVAQPSFGILNRKAFSDDPEKGYNVGTGAFKLKTLVESDTCTVERFDDFWDGVVKTEEITFKTILEPSAELIAVQNGEVDIALNINPEEYGLVEEDSSLDLVRFTGSSLNYLAVNAGKNPTSNVKLRQAIAYAMNVDDIIMGAAGGEGIKATSFWGWDQFGFNPDIKPYEQDIEKARLLMKEAGYENGVDLEIVSFASNYKLIAQILQAQLKEIGINISIKEMDFSAATEYTSALQHDMVIIGFSNNPYGDDSRRSHTPGISSNRSAMDNKEIMQLFDSAQQELDETKRLMGYKRIQEITHEEAAAIPMYFNQAGIAVRKGLEGMWLEGGNAHNLTYAAIREN